jgi:hypothetical protein
MGSIRPLKSRDVSSIDATPPWNQVTAVHYIAFAFFLPSLSLSPNGSIRPKKGPPKIERYSTFNHGDDDIFSSVRKEMNGFICCLILFFFVFELLVTPNNFGRPLFSSPPEAAQHSK